MAKDALAPDVARDLPVMHGYFREYLLMTATEKAEIRAGFEAFAEKNDYRLGKIFMERVETAPDALRALVTAVLDDKAAAIAVPSLVHFSVFGHPIAIQKQLEAALHAPVLCSRATT
ncbi:hypothetical protein ACIBL3_05025 [Kribbella sp. NPDC050124]|uniref:hypothetical protein n=1 Tax=Kribbella sp. NPDC050124 TaxID=3364114 RepID=UPI0037BE0FBA